MSFVPRLLAAAACAAAFTAPVGAAVLAATDASWSVTTAAPGAGWNSATGFDASSWSAATVLFNVGPFYPPGTVVADAIWSAGGQFSTSETAVWGRRILNLAAAPVSATLFGGIDDDGDFFVNGTLVAASHDGVAGGLGPVDITPYLVAGDNVLAFSATDNWPTYGYNHQAWWQVDGRLATAAVPEPASAGLLLLGLGLLGARRVSAATAQPRRLARDSNAPAPAQR